MPSRAPPKAYHVLVKTHKLTVFLTVHPSTTVAALKQEALSALTSPVLSSAPPCIPTAPGNDNDDDVADGEDEVPRVQSTAQFELCRAVKDKGKPNALAYEILDPSHSIQGLLGNWEKLYVQFRDEDGNLLPVQVSQASLLDEEEDDARRPPPAPESPPAVGKGKRKAPPE